MSTLNDAVGQHRTDGRAMADLASSCGIGSTDVAARAFDVVLPVVVDRYSDAVQTTVGSTALHAIASQLSRAERRRPAAIFGSTNHPRGREVADQLFGLELPFVCANLAQSAGLGSADRLIEIVSLVCLASAADSGENVAEVSAFAAALGAAGTSQVSPVTPALRRPAGTPFLAPRATASRAPRAPSAAASTAAEPLAPRESPRREPAETVTPIPVAVPLVSGTIDGPDDQLVEEDDDDRRSGFLWLIGAVAIVLLLFAGIAAFGGDDGASDPDAASGTTATTSGTTESDVDPVGTDPAAAVADLSVAEPAAVEPPVAEEVDVDIDPVATDPIAIEAPDAVLPQSVGQDVASAEEVPTGDDPAAVDFSVVAEGPDVQVMAIPLRDIADPERDASGVLDFSFNTETGEVCYGVTSNGITGPYRSHIHAGDFGVKGGIVVELGQLESGDSRCVDNLPVDTNAILANPAGHYAEIHDTGGEWTLRGQLTERVVGDIVRLSVPMKDEKAINPDADGLITFDFNTVTGEICYAVESTNVAGPYSSHIHVGSIGVKGGIVVELGKLSSGDSACVDNLPVDTNAILADPAGHYAELHDTSDEWTVRGQLSKTVATEAGANGEPGSVGSDHMQVDADGGGAFIRLEQGTIFIEGAVADRDTADRLVDSMSNVDDGTPVVNNLTVDAAAPLPSGRIVIADAIFFRTDSARIQEIDANTLRAITALAKSQPGSVLTVVGHTDDRGPDVVNLELSLIRATATRDLLVELGLPAEDLRIRGAGETAPIGDNSTSAGRALNRRIEFELAPPA